MMTEQQLIERFLVLQEHPEQMTDDELQQFLDNPQMQELTEQMAFAKRAFKSREMGNEAPDVEKEWAKFAATHFEEEETMPRRTSVFSFNSSFQKVAACFIGVLLVTCMAFAAIRIARHSAEKEQESLAQDTHISIPKQEILSADTVKTDTKAVLQPVVFDNVRLDEMLAQIAAYYHTETVFRNESARQLRFHFVWKHEEGIGRVIRKLDRFESLDIRLEDNRIIVE
ncbi:MAG: DUF4974 domain-containing protein [Bacteroidaceae bacterium]|nr:DUF4974 domain-containing protein [Bacteroidaceae bacterium]